MFVCLRFFLFFACMHVRTLVCQPCMDATNFARLTTDVSIYFGSESVLCNNTISCLLVRDIIFQAYVFPIKAPVPVGSFSITLASPGRDCMLLTDRLQSRTFSASTETRARWRNTTLSTETRTTKMGRDQQYMESSWAMPTRMVIQ